MRHIAGVLHERLQVNHRNYYALNIYGVLHAVPFLAAATCQWLPMKIVVIVRNVQNILTTTVSVRSAL